MHFTSIISIPTTPQGMCYHPMLWMGGDPEGDLARIIQSVAKSQDAKGFQCECVWPPHAETHGRRGSPGLLSGASWVTGSKNQGLPGGQQGVSEREVSYPQCQPGPDYFSQLGCGDRKKCEEGRGCE